MSAEEILAASKARIETLLAPIDGGVGEDISYDPSFEEIKDEVEKLQSLSGETVNWEKVGELSEELLRGKSKDFRLACYYGATQLRQKTLEGMVDALVLVKEMAATFWEDMFPPLRRIRARANMLGWMSDQAVDAMEIKLTAADRLMVETVDALSVELDGEFREKFGDSYPGISQIREACRHFIRTCPKEEKKPPPEQKTAAAPAAAAAARPAAPMQAAEAPPANPAAVTDAEQAARAIPKAGGLLAKMGLMMRQAKPDDAMAYRLSRMGMWLDLDAAPPATDGKTLVPPPPDGLKAAWDGLAGTDDLALISQAEEAAADYVLWLDPHRYVINAMDRLGALFIKAKEALVVEVAIMLKRAPTLPNLAFSDGTPLADGQTKMWLESAVLSALGGEGGGGGGGSGAGPSPLDEPLAEARGLAVKGQLGEAITVISKAAAAAPSPADRFRGQLALAQLCLQSGKFDVARAQLDGLTEVIRRHDLTAWQPELCAEVFAGLYAAHSALNEGEGEDVPADRLAAQQAAFEQLCQLDPAAALKLGGGPSGG